MYINEEINWLKFCKKKRIFIFGAGKIGKRVFYQLQNECDIEVTGVIDNNNFNTDLFFAVQFVQKQAAAHAKFSQQMLIL